MTHRRMPAVGMAVVLGLGACFAWDRTSEPTAAQTVTRPPGWHESTHGSKVAPDYARLFGMDVVHEIHITISAQDYRAMQQDLQSIGAGRGGRGPGGPGAPGAPPGVPGVPGPPPGGPGGGRGGQAVCRWAKIA